MFHNFSKMTVDNVVIYRFGGSVSAHVAAIRTLVFPSRAKQFN